MNVHNPAWSRQILTFMAKPLWLVESLSVTEGAPYKDKWSSHSLVLCVFDYLSTQRAAWGDPAMLLVWCVLIVSPSSFSCHWLSITFLFSETAGFVIGMKWRAGQLHKVKSTIFQAVRTETRLCFLFLRSFFLFILQLFHSCVWHIFINPSQLPSSTTKPSPHILFPFPLRLFTHCLPTPRPSPISPLLIPYLPIASACLPPSQTPSTPPFPLVWNTVSVFSSLAALGALMTALWSLWTKSAHVLPYPGHRRNETHVNCFQMPIISSENRKGSKSTENNKNVVRKCFWSTKASVFHAPSLIERNNTKVIFKEAGHRGEGHLICGRLNLLQWRSILSFSLCLEHTRNTTSKAGRGSHGVLN